MNESQFFEFAEDGKLSGAKLKQHMVKACQELDRLRLHKLLNQYLLFITQAGVQFYLILLLDLFSMLAIQ